MNRERALKVVLGFVGLIFLASVYPLVIFVRQAPDLSMMFSLYVTLGIFLLLAVRNPSESRSLIAFTAWSSFAHAAVMGLQLPMQGVSLCPPRQQTPAHRRGGVGACCDRERFSTRHREAMGSGRAVQQGG